MTGKRDNESVRLWEESTVQNSTPFDQSFCRSSLSRVIGKRDFRGVPKADQDTFREALLAQATLATEG